MLGSGASSGKQSAVNLEAAGLSPHLIVGDGATVIADGGPFDRVHSTCAVAQIPYTWVTQCRPGAVIVTPFRLWFGWGHLARLDVLPDGTAVGRFPATADYMMIRSQRYAGNAQSEWVESRPECSVTTTRVDPQTVAWAPAEADLVISALVPGVTARRARDAFWLLDGNGPGGAWAVASCKPGDSFEVRQTDDRCLWDEVEAAYFRWASWGRPGLERFGITVTPNDQHLWLDDPSQVIGTG